MTLKTSFIAGLAIVALVVGVQTASGQSPSDASNRATLDVTTAPLDAFERAVAANRRDLENAYVDAHQRLERGGKLAATSYPDAFERAVAAQQRTGAFFASDSHDRMAPANVPVAVPPATSGSEIEWPQIGIGFGLGIMLALGLWLMVRASHIRPLGR